MYSIWKKLDTQHELLAELNIGQNPMQSAVKNYFRIPIVWSSNSIDGSTFNKSDTRKILEDEVSVGHKPIKDLLAVVGLNKAYEHMFRLASFDRVSEEDILDFHRLIGDSLNNSMEAGLYRKTKVSVPNVDGKEFPGPEAMSWLMKDLLKKCDLNRFLMHPIRFGVNFHITIMDTLPFEEGNGRIARMVMNTIFLQKGYLPIAIDPSLRREYMFGFSGSDEKNVEFFENFIADLVSKTQEDFLKTVEAKKIVI
ncbi:MAG: Fic family protein [Deltaproteobacteria bacterium]|jgi:Fic family protein|nr:Fic family protein [Deltaproteobacteria bacterium]